MAVVPIRPKNSDIEIEEAPRTDPTAAVTITTDDQGITTIEIPGTGKAPKAPRGKDDKFDRNLAEDMDPGQLAALASWLLESIEADEQEDDEWEETVNRCADYLGIDVINAVASPSTDGTISRHVSTALLEAALKMWSTSYGELLPATGPVKTQKLDAVPTPDVLAANPGQGITDPEQTDQARDLLADALQQDMNWYLTTGDRGYYPDYSKMLMNRNLVGRQFREIYRCPVERKPLSRWIMAQDFIVSGSPTHLSQAPRMTVRKKVGQGLMRRFQKTGLYLDTPLAMPQGEPTSTEIVVGETEGVLAQRTLPRDYKHQTYECSTDISSYDLTDQMGDWDILDADETGHVPGWSLPYFVTLDKDSRQILAIRRNWKQGDEDYRRKRRYVSYAGIPAYGGGFRDWGLLQVASNPEHGSTMLLRSSVDAAIFSNFPAWVASQGAGTRQENTVIRPNFGEVWKMPGSMGQDINKMIMPLPYKPPTAESMALKQGMEKDVANLAGVIEIPVGEGRIGNTPVGTIMSYIESVTMVPGAIHKADHATQAEEFELLRELLAEEPEALWRGNKSPARQWQTAEELLAPDIFPKSDPNTQSQIHRLMKAQGLIMIGGLPQFAAIADNDAIFRHVVPILAGTDAESFEKPPAAATPPPPDPKIVAAQIKAQSETQAGQVELQKAQVQHDAKMQEIAAEGKENELNRQSEETRSAMTMEAAKIKGSTALANAHMDNTHDAQQQGQDRQLEIAKHVTPPAAPPAPPAPLGPAPGAGPSEDVPQ